jgi:WD40 repeat protein
MCGVVQAIKAFQAHTAPVTAVAWRPGTGHQVASASLDGAVKLWDARSPVALATLSEGQAGALSAVAWGAQSSGDLLLVSGGAEGTLRIYDAPEAGTGAAVES